MSGEELTEESQHSAQVAKPARWMLLLAMEQSREPDKGRTFTIERLWLILISSKNS